MSLARLEEHMCSFSNTLETRRQ
uniref:Uncharacterized protein n=1 Tax=Anguilla anguilla TaxID=7936 RepID=A0A0E9W0E6_ANGAN